MSVSRKRLPALERKAQIFNVAAEVFSDKGYRNASVTDIVERAGIGRGTFYLYSNSKRDIFLELIESYFAGFASLLEENHVRLESSFKDGSNPLVAWRENILSILRYHQENPHLAHVIYQEAIGRDEDFSARVEELSRLARQKVREELGIMDRYGMVRPCDLDLATTMIMGSLIYIIMDHLLKVESIDPEELADEILEYHVRALAPTGWVPEQGLRHVLGSTVED
jgi:AcrR family transcriptional regulator